MKLDEVRGWFAGQGMPFSWRRDLGHEARLTPLGRTLPLGGIEAAIVVPDVHLGWGNDPFFYNDVQRAQRLERFLDKLAALRDTVGAGAFTAIQLGDWYDFWRTPQVNTAADRSVIEHRYRGICDKAAAVPLLHCIGNHDAALFASPPDPAQLDVAIARSIGTPSVLCFHGHDLSTLQDIYTNAVWDETLLQVLNTINTLPVLGRLSSFLQRWGDNSFNEPWSGKPDSKPWPGATIPGPDDLWHAPWVGRDDATKLAQAIRGFEFCLNARGSGAPPVQVELALVGHSHRPGISWGPITADRDIPIIDVGSWTYGRAEFAVVCADGVGLAALDV
jgi:hypothetical protein